MTGSRSWKDPQVQVLRSLMLSPVCLWLNRSSLFHRDRLPGLSPGTDTIMVHSEPLTCVHTCSSMAREVADPCTWWRLLLVAAGGRFWSRARSSELSTACWFPWHPYLLLLLDCGFKSFYCHSSLFARLYVQLQVFPLH